MAFISLLYLCIIFVPSLIKGDEACYIEKSQSPEAETFFKLTMRDPVNYIEPLEHNFFCRRQSGGFCVFPQNTRSMSYWRNTSSDINAYFPFFHPYIYQHGKYGAKSADKVTITYTEYLLCGTFENDKFPKKSLENRHLAPRTRMVETGISVYEADYYDEYVDQTGRCQAFPCPLTIKIYSPDFVHSSYNGYYILNYPASYQGGFLDRESPPFIPSYRHISRNLYLYPKFKTLLSKENGFENVGKYIITSSPRKQNCIDHRIEMLVEHAVKDLTFGKYPQRYCFSHGNIVGMNHTDVKDGKAISKKTIRKFEVRPTSKQCGMTYRGSENTLLGTGLQPFVVRVDIKGAKCIGTLISPMHVLTLASCFLMIKDYFDIQKNVIAKCGMKKGWKECRRWMANNELEGTRRPPITVKTFESFKRTGSVDLPVDYFEVHPLFNGIEFDVAIIALQSYIQRNVYLHPICLPKWNVFDEEGKPTIDRLYRSFQWENYQMLYSLKAFAKDIRFTSVYTDVNGPAKFMKCEIANLTSNWRNHCNLNPYKPPPNLIYDSPIGGNLYDNEDPVEAKNDDGSTKYACNYFYHILNREEFDYKLTPNQRQIRGLRDNVIECFSVATLEFLDESQRGIKCYERRERCLKYRGWCYVGKEYGYCNDINEIPDTPDAEYPLFEVQTFILPKSHCNNSKIINSESRICTGHVTRGPSEYIFQVSKQFVQDPVTQKAKKKVVYEAVEFIGGIQRPLVKAPDETGRMKIVSTALEGTCHGAGTVTDYDIGAPTYFRYPVETSGNGQPSFPGTAHAVLYSLQRTTGRSCDFKTYTDTEVLIATSDIMEWIETVLMEIDGTKQSVFDIEYSKVPLDLQSMIVTTTSRTTDLVKTTTKFSEVWANKGNFKETIKLTEEANPGFKYFFDYKDETRLFTKPPIIFIENYDFSEANSSANLKLRFHAISVTLLFLFLFEL